MAEKAKCEVVIVGAGPAGVSCGYVLARAGMEVSILERGQYPGAKNMFGGVFFTDQMSELIPGFYSEAPVERFVAKRRYSMLVDGSEIAFSFEPEEFKKPVYNHSFIVKRSVFDRWFAKKAEEQGATIVCGATVTDVLWNGTSVAGITTGPGDDNALLADVVVCAEGANSLLSEKVGLRNRLSARTRAIGVKEVIRLSSKVINDRFGLTGEEGAAYEYFGNSVAGMLGNGFIYTNRDSLSVGIAVLISELSERGNAVSPSELLQDFKNHPCVSPLVRHGETLEYSAHLIPMDGHDNLPQLTADGILLVGDAAGLVNNNLSHEGVNMAMASGIMAAETILKNRTEHRYDAGALSLYERLLRDSFVLNNMKSSRDFVNIMHTHKEFLDDFPGVLKDALVRLLKVDDVPKRTAKRDAWRMLRSRIGLGTMAKAFVSLSKAGI